MKYFYRFRSIDKLLGSKSELLTQSIYFAEPSSLNDPMEGAKIIFWKGDCVLWENFLRHYIFSLTKLYLALKEDNLDENTIENSILSMLKSYPQEESYQKIFDAFISNKDVESYIKEIAKLSLNAFLDSKEVAHLLFNLHQYCIDSIQFELEKIRPKSNNLESVNDFLNKGYFDSRTKLSLEESGAIFEEQYFNTERDRLNFRLGVYKTIFDKYGNAKASMLNAVFHYFPEIYLRKIELLMHPKWYASCFMSSETNSAVWGHYGDNHQGVCLKFKSGFDGKLHKIDLFDHTNTSRTFQFHEVKYKKFFPEIDFFNSLGRFSNPILSKFWMKNAKGVESDQFEGFNSNYKHWKESYWSNFLSSITSKTDDWEYENEYRLVLDSFLNDYCTKDERVFKYDFSSLEGIIFGINTPIERKLEIINIVKQKCYEVNRLEFSFYQAFYKDGVIDNFDLHFDFKSGLFRQPTSNK